MKINFLGLVFTLVAMQAEIGTLFVTTVAKTGVENYSSIAAMAQASATRAPAVPDRLMWFQAGDGPTQPPRSPGSCGPELL